MDASDSNTAPNAQSFLTEAQRAALDAALASKERNNGSSPPRGSPRKQTSVRKHGAVHVKPQHGLPGDRKSKNPRSGEAKKKGAGGKFTWGAVLSDTAGPKALDKNDPNYDSDDDAIVQEVELTDGDDDDESAALAAAGQQTNCRIVRAVAELKLEIMTMLQEYLESGDVDEAARCIGSFRLPMYDYYIVKRAITLACDRKDREREAVSLLLSSLYGQCISPQQMQKGFVAVLEDLDELVLDVPDAVSILALFIGRAVIDEVLPPTFIGRVLPPAGSHLESLKKICTGHLEQPHGAERLLRCWGSEAKLSFKDARGRIIAMLKEFVNSDDVAEVERQLRALNAPFLHHDVVKQAVLMAAEDPPHCKEPMLKLLDALTHTAEISSLQAYKGFQRCVDQLDDLALDIPNLDDNFHDFYGECIARGVLDPADQTLLDEAETRRRGVGGDAAESDTAAHVKSVAEFKAKALAAVAEYYNSSDAGEVERILKEDGQPGMRHIFVHVAIQSALGRTFRDREAVSALLVALAPNNVPESAIFTAYTRLLAKCEDLVLDVPDAVHLLTLFLARLVVDEVVPPALLTRLVDAQRPESLGLVVVRSTAKLLSAPHAAERVLQCWRGGVRNSRQLQADFSELIREYLSSCELPEAVRSLHELGAKAYHHEFVRRCVDAAYEKPGATERVIALLEHVSASGEVSQTQLAKGLARAKQRLPDSTLDCPAAASILDGVIEHGHKHKWLDADASLNGTT